MSFNGIKLIHTQRIYNMAWTTPVDWTTGQMLSAADLNKVNANLNALKSPPYDLKKGNGSTTMSTASTTYVDVSSSLNISFTTYGGLIMLGFTGTVAIPAGANFFLDVEVDGLTQLGNGSLFYFGNSTPAGLSLPVTFTTFTAALTANQSHSFALRWKATAGTVTLINNANSVPIFWAREV
jgi:hypothetical protein